MPALTDGESGVLGYGALYHPWPVVGRPDAGGLRAVSPDGGIAGTYAARARAHGAWIAPARMPLTAVLALAPTVEADGLASMVGAAINPVAADPSGHMALTAATMTDVAAIRPVNVRRLVMLLRRLARRDGAGIVFEPNDRTLQRLVRMRFERLLTAMFHRGAFAGAVPAEAFEVSTGGGVNSAASIDAGRFVVEIRFAPSRPLEFITVRLVLAGTDRGEESV
ncbi:phage tail sheath C-terminal domain-containing protein [Rhodococcus aetherivorans]